MLIMDWNLYSFVVRSERRKSIISSLDRPKTPTEIAKEIKVSTPHVSRSMKDFSEKGLVRCLTPNAKVGRIYELTARGKDVRKMVGEGHP